MLPSKRAHPSGRQENIKTSASPEPPMEVVETPSSGKPTPEEAVVEGEGSADVGGKAPTPSVRPPRSVAASSGPPAKGGREGVKAGSSGSHKAQGGAVSRPDPKAAGTIEPITWNK